MLIGKGQAMASCATLHTGLLTRTEIVTKIEFLIVLYYGSGLKVDLSIGKDGVQRRKEFGELLSRETSQVAHRSITWIRCNLV